MNIFDASRRMVGNYAGGIEAVAPRLNKSPETMAKELRNANGFKWGAEDARLLTEMCVEERVPNATAYAEVVARAAHCRLVPLPTMPDLPLSNAVSTIAATSQAVHKLIGEACDDLSDGVISDNEFARIDRLFGEVASQMHTMRRAFLALNQTGKPQVVE